MTSCPCIEHTGGRMPPSSFSMVQAGWTPKDAGRRTDELFSWVKRGCRKDSLKPRGMITGPDDFA